MRWDLAACWDCFYILFLFSDQRAGAQVEGTRAWPISCGTKGDSYKDLLSLALLYEMVLSILLIVLLDQRDGAQVEGTRTPAICGGTKGDSLNDVLSSILLYD